RLPPPDEPLPALVQRGAKIALRSADTSGTSHSRQRAHLSPRQPALRSCPFPGRVSRRNKEGCKPDRQWARPDEKPVQEGTSASLHGRLSLHDGRYGTVSILLVPNPARSTPHNHESQR